MGSLKQVDADVTAAPKAVLLQDTLLVHLLTSLHPCLGTGKRGKLVYWYVIFGNGKGSGPGTGSLDRWLSSSTAQAQLQQLPHQVCQGDGLWRAVWGPPGGTEPYQKLLGLCQDLQECWLFWLSSPLVPPPLQGTVLHEHSQTACGPVGKVLWSERTETNQLSAGILLALQVREPGTAEDPALQTAKPGCPVRAKRGEKAAWQNQLSQLRNAFRSNCGSAYWSNGCFLSLAAVSTLERALILKQGPKRA